MLPKAAFQFGIKAGDGRKSGKDLTRKQDNKLMGQLRQIQARFCADAPQFSLLAFLDIAASCSVCCLHLNGASEATLVWQSG